MGKWIAEPRLKEKTGFEWMSWIQCSLNILPLSLLIKVIFCPLCIKALSGKNETEYVKITSTFRYLSDRSVMQYLM